jgi:hypothetical protein
LRFIEMAADQDDIRACGSQPRSHGKTEAFGAASDEGGAAGEVELLNSRKRGGGGHNLNDE